MNNTQTSPDTSDNLTQHAMLFIWGLYARQIGLVQALENVKLKQKTRTHSPQKKVLEFLVAIMAGLPHLKDISHSAHPLDQDLMVAEAWGQESWADYSGVSRTLQQLNVEEVTALIAALENIDHPFIDQEIERSLKTMEMIIYDGDLTGRPVSDTSTSYPDTAFGHMGDAVRLGYQSALVSMHSPTFGRIWLSNQLHPGNTVSMSEAQALVLAAERRTGRLPKRRTDLLASRLAAMEATLETTHLKLDQSFDAHRKAEWAVKDTVALLREWTHEVNGLTADYERENHQPTPYCKLSQAKRKIETYSKRLPRCQKTVGVAKRRLARHEAQYIEEKAAVEALQAHYRRLLDDNATNADPIQAIFRLDGGFASLENIYWLIEMGYEVYTRGRSTIVRDTLSNALNPETDWVRVGGNAELTAWAKTTVDGYFAYPMDIALAHYHTGDSIRKATLLHYGQTEVVADLDAWFHMYNGRQTIEAGIKEGKNVFQMHHLKVRSPQALRLQEHLACFAANFVRFAADWLISLPQPKMIPTESVKEMVQAGAHTSAWVRRQGDVWLLRFTEQSCYAGYFLRFGKGVAQLPLPLFKSIHFSHF